MGTGKDLHRRKRGAHGGLQEDSGHLPASFDPQVEAGRSSRRFPALAPPSLPPSPTWRGCASPSAQAPSSPSCRGSGRSSPTAGPPPSAKRWATSGGRLIRDEETGEPFKVPCCPACTAQIVDKDGVPLTGEDLSRRKRVCAHCGSALWQADNSGPRRYLLADYVKHRMKNFFGLLIGDEVHGI